nr:MAG TPA: hypothetical protein [Caudoviricetes sp.]
MTRLAFLIQVRADLLPVYRLRSLLERSASGTFRTLSNL